MHVSAIVYYLSVPFILLLPIVSTVSQPRLMVPTRRVVFGWHGVMLMAVFSGVCIDPLKLVLSSLPMIDTLMDIACGGCNINTLVRFDPVL